MHKDNGIIPYITENKRRPRYVCLERGVSDKQQRSVALPQETVLLPAACLRV